MLSEEETKIVQESYAGLYDQSDHFSVKFYNNLFEIAPTTRKLFGTDISSQGRKFMEVLSIIVLDLADEELIIPFIQAMGRRHVGYGAKPEHYQIVGNAFIKTLDQAFEGEWSNQEKTLWIKLYTHIAEIMIEAAAGIETPSN